MGAEISDRSVEFFERERVGEELAGFVGTAEDIAVCPADHERVGGGCKLFERADGEMF